MTFETPLLACRSVCRTALALATSFGLWAAATSAWATDPRFVPNISGEEVTDTQTGLIWRRCSEGQTWTGSACGGSAGLYAWESALAEAKSVAGSTGVAWRLPNVKELQTLVHRGSIKPAVDSSVFPNTPSSWFWTSTPYAGDACCAWYVNFFDGYVSTDRRYGYNGAVRLVRAGQ